MEMFFQILETAWTIPVQAVDLEEDDEDDDHDDDDGGADDDDYPEPPPTPLLAIKNVAHNETGETNYQDSQVEAMVMDSEDEQRPPRSPPTTEETAGKTSCNQVVSTSASLEISGAKKVLPCPSDLVPKKLFEGDGCAKQEVLAKQPSFSEHPPTSSRQLLKEQLRLEHVWGRVVIRTLRR